MIADTLQRTGTYVERCCIFCRIDPGYRCRFRCANTRHIRFITDLNHTTSSRTVWLPVEVRCELMKIKVNAYVETIGMKIGRRTYFVNVHMCSKIGASRCGRLFPVHFVTGVHAYAHTDIHTARWHCTVQLRWKFECVIMFNWPSYLVLFRWPILARIRLFKLMKDILILYKFASFLQFVFIDYWLILVVSLLTSFNSVI